MIVLGVAIGWLLLLALVAGACRSAAAGDRWLVDQDRAMEPPRLVPLGGTRPRSPAA